MIKLVALIKRRPGWTLEAFLTYYEQQHVPLFARAIPAEVADAIRYYAQNHPVRLGAGTAGPPYDCVTEFGFDDLDGLRKWTSWYLGPEGKVLRDDEERFMDTDQRIVIVTEEHRLPHR
jgi:uncharacterized protein (TIGR02118 family)